MCTRLSLGSIRCSLGTLLVIGIATVPLPLQGQSGPALGSGSRIRITAPAHGLQERRAELHDVTDDAFIVRLEDDGEPLRVELAGIEKLDVWSGRKLNAVKGLAIGGGVGAVGGAIYGFASGGSFIFTREEAAGAGALLFGAAGALSGLAIGALIESDRWTTVDPDDLPITVRPTIDGSGASVSVRMVIRAP